jgi:ATP-dependent RNA helicase SUPV3L1/SUV3
MVEPFEEEAGVTALLGPTNTGKTHRALERMLEHNSGMIGLPLRLLAREVYDRLTSHIGERAVALVTGEEKRVPKNPRYWVCTVEAMPMDVTVDFVAIDEIQLGAHPERGHIFTDRLLHARGRKETWFLGSETVRPLIEQLLPTAKIKRHPRLSQLRGVPPVGLNSLPKRSAVVAFSAQRVYELGERIRRKHGGAALVLGALSPRTRNAQVALYQSGEVDYLVATDAIGMGLNLDISHVFFADLNKFDGRETRPLELPELAQIAGRAGRYLDDGCFGVLAPTPAFSPKVQFALEQHRFPKERQLFYRNSDLDRSSLDALTRSLTTPPFRAELRAIQPAEDHRALLALRQKPAIAKLACTPERVALLWEICQIPDYQQLLFELHLRLLEDIYLQLTGPTRKLDPTWIDEQVQRISNPKGDIDTLMARISAIRTWNYVAQRPEWLEHGPALALRAREIEDQLSDALHQALLARFVEQRKAHVVPAHLASPGTKSNSKAHPFAQLIALSAPSNFDVNPPNDSTEKALNALVDAPHDDFLLDVHGRIWFQKRLIGTLTPGVDLLHPDVKIVLAPDPGKGAIARIHRRLTAFTRDTIAQLLQPLRVRAIEQLSTAAHGLVYQLEQSLGSVSRTNCNEQLCALTPRDRQLLASLGLRFGGSHLYFKRQLTEQSLRQRLALAGAYFRTPTQSLEALTTRKSIPSPETRLPSPFSLTVGFVTVGPRWIRLDAYESLCSALIGRAKHGEFSLPKELTHTLDCDEHALPELLYALGYVRRASGRFALGKPLYGSSKRLLRNDVPKKSPRRPNHQGYSPTDNRSES